MINKKSVTSNDKNILVLSRAENGTLDISESYCLAGIGKIHTMGQL